ncbi:MAG: hypothetical protein ACSHX7_01600 [Luteolibacter sp.]
MIRVLLAALLVLLTVFAALVFSADFSKDPDPGALFEIQAVRLERDQSYFWLEVHLKKSGEKDHDLEKLPKLVTSTGKIHRPADTVFAGTPEKGFSEIWYKFWLEEKDLKGTLKLEMNEGVLTVKSSDGAPSLESGKEKTIRNADWGKIWLGF